MQPDLTDLLRRLRTFQPEALADPYAIYRRLREQDPVHWYVAPTGVGQWDVFRYQDIVAALRDPRLSARRQPDPTLVESLPEPRRSMTRAFNAFTAPYLLSLDPPDHTRLRALFTKAFSPRVVERLRVRVQRLVDEHLDAVQGTGGMEVIADFAYPVPASVISDLFGLPPADRVRLRHWSQAISEFFGGRADVEVGWPTIQEMVAYLRGVVAERRRHPGEDLLSELVRVEQEGDRLSEGELLANCVLLLFAGHETTTNLIGNGLLALLRHPGQLQALRADPTLVAPAVEELLRYDSPAQSTVRVAVGDTELGGRHIRPGERVNLWRAAANRDPEVFPDPDRLDLGRKDNRHLSFAHGIHYCLGAALARLEGHIAFATLLRRFPTLRLASDQVQWRANVGMRGLVALPVRFA